MTGQAQIEDPDWASECQLFESGAFARDGSVSRKSSWNGSSRALTRFPIPLTTSSTSSRFLRTRAASSVAARSPESLSINPDAHTAFANLCRQFSNSVIRSAISGVVITAFTYASNGTSPCSLSTSSTSAVSSTSSLWAAFGTMSPSGFLSSVMSLSVYASLSAGNNWRDVSVACAVNL
jgi:hypothetical protein